MICIKVSNCAKSYISAMENEAVLEKYGLFRAKVPRFTSYPPANRFELETGRRRQASWLQMIESDTSVSLYVHIPFCKRLCYFCACRTQGTQTLKPVASYIETFIREVRAVRALLPSGLRMGRLHFGGGTPTILDVELMNRLCEAIYTQFEPAPDFEFSVEIDPTEASDAVLLTLADWRLGRASIGVQDFEPKVQETIGRVQSFEQTKSVVDRLRALGTRSINLDLVYGLPHQSEDSLSATLDQVLTLSPDRLALYGYAHVPQMSKRQVMISAEDLPGARARFRLAQMARARFLSHGLFPIGIDHFGAQTDSLTMAAKAGHLRRNFQGYTDDPFTTLIGLGASAISELPGGYVQNAVATAGYLERVRSGGLAGHRGYAMSRQDRALSDLVQGLMCFGRVDLNALKDRHPSEALRLDNAVLGLGLRYPDAVELSPGHLEIRPEAMSLTRVLASAAASEQDGVGSLAI